jgi:hypothetical protein
MSLPRLNPAPARPRHRVTGAEIEKIQSQFRRLPFEPFRRQYVLAEVDRDHADELDRMRSEREQYASEWRDVFLIPGADSLSHIESAADEARSVVEHLRLDADDPEIFGAIVAAVRAGRVAGEADVDRLLQQGVMPAPASPATCQSAGAELTLRDAVALYRQDKQMIPKTDREVEQALETFEGLIGNKNLTALTRSDFQQFLKHLGEQTVGGKSEGSIERPASAATVGKKLGFLRAAINHAEDRGVFTGVNPASNHRVKAWVRPTPPRSSWGGRRSTGSTPRSSPWIGTGHAA